MNPKIQYDDFEIEVRSINKGRSHTRAYEVRVLKSPRGRVGSSFVLPYPADGLNRILSAMERCVLTSARAGRDLTWEDQECEPMSALEIEELGQKLFGALFPEDVDRHFRESLGIVHERGGDRRDSGLRLRVTFDRKEDFALLATLPWEFLWDQGRFVNRNRLTPVVRSLNVPEPSAFGVIEPPLRVLLISSNPENVKPLDTAHETKLVKATLDRNSEIKVVTMRHPKVHELRQRLLDEHYHVVHFMGHGGLESGRDEFALYFEDEDHQAVPVKGMQLAEYLQDIPNLQLVVLNSCWSGALPRHGGQDPFKGVAAALVRRGGIPAVVAMQFPISDDAAIAFSRAFYERLAAGDPISAAVTEGRLAILDLEPESLEWATPVVFLAGEDRGFEIRPASGPPSNGAPPTGPVEPGRPKSTAPLRLAVRSFHNAYIADTETPDGLLDLTSFFKEPDGRHIKAHSLWHQEIYPRLHEFLRRFEKERRPLIFDFAAHATIAFAAGYCLEAKSGLDVTLLQRGMQGGVRPWQAEAGPARKGPLWREEPEVVLDSEKPAVAMAVSATTTILPDVDFYLKKSRKPVGRIVPMTLYPQPSGSGVEDGLHALQLAQDLSLRIRARSPQERMKPLHLFAAAPNALLFFLGQLARSFGEVQLYEHDFPSGKPGAYTPSLRLPVRPSR